MGDVVSCPNPHPLKRIKPWKPSSTFLPVPSQQIDFKQAFDYHLDDVMACSKSFHCTQHCIRTSLVLWCHKARLCVCTGCGHVCLPVSLPLRILDEHFEEQLNEVIRLCPKSRQTMLFSATMTDQVMREGPNFPLRIRD